MKLNIQRFAVSKSTSFSESNVSIQNNTSSLTITIYFSPNNDKTFFSSATLYCTCNGVEQSKKVSLSKGGSVSASFTFNNIKHNNDGTKSVSWNWNCNTGTSVLGNISDSGSRNLTKIARASSISFDSSSVELGQPVTISLTKHIEGSTDTLSFNINGTTGTIGTTDEDSYIWTPPLILAEEITNSTSGICVITCTSYDDDTLIGSSNANLTLEIPSSVVPSVSIGTLTEADETMIAKDWGVFVQNKSKINIPITATGIYESTIQSIVTTINGLSFTGDSVVTSTLVTAGTNTITTTVTDSRGRTATTTKTYVVVPYANPNIQIAQAQRCLQDGTLSDNGTYLLYDFKASVPDVSNNNTATHRIGYKRTTDSSYTYVTISSNYNIDISDQVSSFTISADYPYDIKFETIDSFMSAEIDRPIDTGFDLMNFNASGKSMAIGKVSEANANEELLEIGLTTKFLENIDAEDIDANDITSQSVSSTTGSFTSLKVNNIDYLAPYVLYDDATGETGTVTLIDSASNYEYFDIIYRTNDNCLSSVKVNDPDGKRISLMAQYGSGTQIWIKTAVIDISGTSITKNKYNEIALTSGSAVSVSANNLIYITQVIGYK